MKQAAILAGGKGSRLSKIFSQVPKPMVPIGGRPLLEHIIETLARQGITDLVLFTGFESVQIEKHFGDGAKFGTRIRYVVEPEPMGSAGSLLQNLSLLAPEFFIVYGDTLFNVDLKRFAEFHSAKNADISLFLHPNDHPYDSDLLETDSDGRVTAFHKAPHSPDTFYRNLVNAALYAVNGNALAGLEFETHPDFARDVFPRLLGNSKRLYGYVSREYIKDMGTPDRFDGVERDFKSGKVARGTLEIARPAIFIDRDGTLTKATDYVFKPEQLELYEDAGAAIAKVNSSSHMAVLVTNQPVVARGDVTESGLQTIHNKLETLLGRERSYLDAIYFCPHHPDKGFKGERPELKIKCDCRKPEPGMIQAAAREHGIDLKSSWLIGDTTTDILTAKNSGTKSVLVRTGYGGRDRKFSLKPDFEVAGLTEAVDFILTDYERIRGLLQGVVSKLEKGRSVVIAGPARTGKSLVASTLRTLLLEKNRPCHVISLDHWLRSDDQRGPTVDQRYNINAISAFVSAQMQGGGWTGHLPYYDRHTRKSDPNGYQLQINAGETLIFEGTIALHVPDLLKLNVVRIYVEAPVEVRKNRFDKEYRLREWDADRIESVFASREKEEIPYIESSKALADFVLNLPANTIHEIKRTEP